MNQRGRKSAASLLTNVDGALDGRPEPPTDLTPMQTEIWRKVVENEASTFFNTAALQALLKEFCRHVSSAHYLSRQVENLEVRDFNPDNLKLYDKFLSMRERETKAMADKATKLRLTNQSRYTPQAAATATKNASQNAKPWEFEG